MAALRSSVSVGFVMALVAPLLAGACAQEEGFQCGVEVPGSDGVIARCDRALEICVCSTFSCARPDLVPVGDAAHFKPCHSGYRYVEAPFAKPELAGACVPDEHLSLTPYVPSGANHGPECVPPVIKPRDAGPDVRDATPDRVPIDAPVDVHVEDARDDHRPLDGAPDAPPGPRDATPDFLPLPSDGSLADSSVSNDEGGLP